MTAVIPLKGVKARKGREVAKPYEPTPQEAKALAKYDRKKVDRAPAPNMKVTMWEEDGGTRAATLKVDHANVDVGYRLLADAIGSWEFLAGTLDSLAMVARKGGIVDQGKNSPKWLCLDLELPWFGTAPPVVSPSE